VSDPQFWNVPNQAGLPTVSAEAIVNAGGLSPHRGKGALIRLDPGNTVTTGPFLKLEWVGATVVYDDLGFFDDSVGFIIPDVDPPITRVRMWTALVWPPTLGSLAFFHGFVGGNVPFTGGGFEQLPEAGTATERWRTVLVSAPFKFDTVPFAGLPLNAFVGQVGAVPPPILSGQQMSIEVVR
jgi:hypothetical protein